MVPDELFDEQLPELSGAELKVLLYIVRRTFGFKKASDNISLNQLLTGIVTKAGERLDRGTGLTKKTLLVALRSLEDKNIIRTERRQSAEKGNEPTTYRLNVIAPSEETTPPLVEKLPQGGGVIIPPSPRGRNYPSQQTVPQETVSQHDVVVATERIQNAGQAVHPAPTPSTAHELADALVAFGITPRVAADLIQRFSESHILSKLDVAAYLVESRSPSVAKNPAGYLRRAIEEDWTAPTGSPTTTRRARQHRAAPQAVPRLDEERHQAERLARQVLAQARTAQASQLPSYPIPGSPLTTETAWSAALAVIRGRVSETNFGMFFRDTQLLRAEAGEALIAAPNGFVRDYLQERLASTIRAALDEVLGQPYEVRIAVVPFAEPAVTPVQSPARPTGRRRQSPGKGKPASNAFS
jgi:hypothetical protein